MEDSQRYPYFIQVLGEALCQAMTGSSTFRVTNSIIEMVRAEVEMSRVDYYVDRYREMEMRDLLPAAVAVGEIYAGGSGQCDSRILWQALQDTGAARDETVAKGHISQLSDLGYIWRPSASVQWEPGISILMPYMLAKQ